MIINKKMTKINKPNGAHVQYVIRQARHTITRTSSFLILCSDKNQIRKEEQGNNIEHDVCLYRDPRIRLPSDWSYPSEHYVCW